MNSLIATFLIVVLFAIVTIIAINVNRAPVRTLGMFAILLPFHSLIITLLYYFGSISVPLAKLASAWKEVALLLTAFAAFVTMFYRSRWGKQVRISYHEVVLILWLLLLTAHLFISPNGTLSQKIFGVRDWLIYLLPFYIGFATLRNAQHLSRAFRLIIVMGVIVAIIGILELMLVPTIWHVRIGVPNYFKDLLGQTYPEYLLQLPENYWTGVGGSAIRRSVSVLLSGQGHALTYLLFIPAATAAFLENPNRRTAAVVVLFLVGVVSTITRMTIVVGIVQMLAMVFMLRLRVIIRLVTVFVVMLFVSGLVFSGQFRTFIIRTITFTDTSSSKRPEHLREGIENLIAQPLGNGVGMAGFTALQFGTTGGDGTELGYRKITDSLGFPGLLLWFAWFGLILRSSYRLARRSTGWMRYMSLAVFSMALGFILNNITAPPDQSTVVVYLFHWLAGAVVYQSMQPRPAGEALSTESTGN